MSTEAQFHENLAHAIAEAGKAAARMAQGYFVRFYDISRNSFSLQYADLRFDCDLPSDEGTLLLASLGLTLIDTPEVPVTLVLDYLKGPSGPRARHREAVAELAKG